MDIEKLSKHLAGRVIAHVARTETAGVEVRFTDDSALIVEGTVDRVDASIREPARSRNARSKDQPTHRQREYLDFISRYMAHYGRSPAESDIQRHFMVSAPSVNMMMKTLERRGFITRQRDFYGQALPRSIRVVVDSF